MQQTFGRPLFEGPRNARRPTAEAERLWSEIAPAFAALEAAVASRSGGRGRVRVSCLSTLAARWLIPRLPDFTAIAPDTVIELTESYATLDRTLGGADLAIRMWTPGGAIPEGLAVVAFMDNAVGLVVAPARHSGGRLVSRSHPCAWINWSVLGGQAVPVGTAIAFDHQQTMIEAAVAGLGAAVAQLPLVQADIAAGHLTAPHGFIPDGAVFAAFGRTDDMTATARRFVDWLCAQGRSPGGQASPPVVFPSAGEDASNLRCGVAFASLGPRDASWSRSGTTGAPGPMFEFGRDLRKLFEKARESEDLGWLEVVGADLVAAEAQTLVVDGGRVSCARPFDTWMRASALWREHARRTGRRSSLEQAAAAASDAARHTTTHDQTAAAAIESAEIHLLRFDLFGGPEKLDVAMADVQALTADRPATRSAAAALHARLTARRARLSGESAAMLDAAALLDAALHGARALPPTMSDDLRLDRAALALEAGVKRRDGRLLDQAGRDLRTLVESASPDYRPLTRARALALAGAGLMALARLARNEAASDQGQALFAAAADQFTPDHSPLDWVAVQLAQTDCDIPLAQLAATEVLTREPGLILGALARERRLAAETALAEAIGDLDGLNGLEAVVRRGLGEAARSQPLAWAADQIGMARLALARGRLTGTEPRAVGMMLAEAVETAREWGAPILVERAERAMPTSEGLGART